LLKFTVNPQRDIGDIDRIKRVDNMEKFLLYRIARQRATPNLFDRIGIFDLISQILMTKHKTSDLHQTLSLRIQKYHTSYEVILKPTFFVYNINFMKLFVRLHHIKNCLYKCYKSDYHRWYTQ
jgi:hypothetical protein